MPDTVLLDAGSGGRASQRLIAEIFQKHFHNPILDKMDDAGLVGSPAGERLSISCDSYTVSPLFFPGGSIGSLAINGTVNDVAMLGAMPRWLTSAFIIEEGLELAVLDRVAEDMARAAKKADVLIVTGDTKVVPRGACDKLFISTSGIGLVYANPAPSGHSARPGDAVLVSGSMGDHGLTIMAARENLSFLSEAQSDCAPLAAMIRALIEGAAPIHTLRDPTRGGLATTLNEIAEQSAVGIEVDEAAVPVHACVQDGCSFMGLDPLYLANEGKLVCILPAENAEKALAIMGAYDQEGAIIGKVTAARPGKVVLRTSIGGERFLGMLEGAQLPRIC